MLRIDSSFMSLIRLATLTIFAIALFVLITPSIVRGDDTGMCISCDEQGYNCNEHCTTTCYYNCQNTGDPQACQYTCTNQCSQSCTNQSTFCQSDCSFYGATYHAGDYEASRIEVQRCLQACHRRGYRASYGGAPYDTATWQSCRENNDVTTCCGEQEYECSQNECIF